jgi:hypothetical protein
MAGGPAGLSERDNKDGEAIDDSKNAFGAQHLARAMAVLVNTHEELC